MITLQPQAQFDLVEIATDLGQRAGLAIAQRFLAKVNQTLAKLEQMPFLGTHSDKLSGRNADLRIWPVKGFTKYLVFYRTRDDDLIVIRVMHGMRDWPALFADDANI